MNELQAQVARVVETIGRVIDGVAPALRPDAIWGGSATKNLGATVGIHGEWRGDVSVVCSDALARRAVDRLLALPAATASLDDLCEAVSELTSRIAGDLRSIFDAQARLGTPLLFEPLVQSPGHAGGEVVAELCFDCLGEPMAVIVTRFPATPVAEDGARRSEPRPRR